jgi:hypothetical protein
VTTRVAEALFLSNNPAINDFIAGCQGEGDLPQRLTRLPSPDEQIRLAFEAIFGREPTPEELEHVRDFLSADNHNAADPAHRWRQAIWAMLTSAEFRYNH